MATVSSPNRLRLLAGTVGVLCLLAGTIASADAAGLSVTSVRFWSMGDVTRVAIEVSGDFRYSSDRIPNPDRLFYDIHDAQSRLRDKGTHIVAVGDKLLKQVRVAQTQLHVTRVVFDLEPDVEVVSSQLSNPNRLMVELRRKGMPPPAPGAPVTPSVTGTRRIEVPVEVLAPKPLRPFVAPEAKAVPERPIPLITADPPRLLAQAMFSREPDFVRWTTSRIQASVARWGAPVPADLKVPVKADLKAPVKKAAPEIAASPARRDSNGGNSMTRVLGLKVGRVVLDPGHGGHDTGTIGPGGTMEKNLVLDVAKRLGALIEERMGSEVVFTRSDDTFVTLEGRTRIANEHRADLFLSIHANASPVRAISGVETYYLNFTTQKSDLDVAARENASSQKSVFELKDLLQKIALSDKVDESREFASKVQAALFAMASRGVPTMRNRGVKKAPFVVLIGASMPSILAEIAFISNPKDEAAMGKAEQRQKLAEALYKGLSQYALTLSHFQVAKRAPQDD
jgi:N-acetylmuramoyl-L-alanine amidase